MNEWVNVNLKKIAKVFSGVIFFDGEGGVEIQECNNFYIIPDESEMDRFIEGDGPEPEFKTIHKWFEPSDGDGCYKFNMYSLIDVKKRDTFNTGQKVNEFKEFLNELSEKRRNDIIRELIELTGDDF